MQNTLDNEKLHYLHIRNGLVKQQNIFVKCNTFLFIIYRESINELLIMDI